MGDHQTEQRTPHLTRRLAETTEPPDQEQTASQERWVPLEQAMLREQARPAAVASPAQPEVGGWE
jgi:hypothetical protein